MPTDTPRTYGNWRRPSPPGLGSLGLIGTGVMLGGIVLSLLVSLISVRAAAVTFVLVALLTGAFALRTPDGRTVFNTLGVRMGWSLRRSRGSTVYVSGPLSRRPGGRFAPPGLLAKVAMLETRDPSGRPAGVLHHQGRNLYTLVLGCEAEGISLVDTDQVDRWVGGWGGWLARLAQEPGLRGAAVVVETAPESGVRLAAEVLPRILDEAPPLSRSVLEEVVNANPVTASETKVYITLTYQPPRARQRPAAVAEQLADRIPALAAGLVGAGTTAVRPLTAVDIAESVRAAFEPAVAPRIAAAREDGGDTGLAWADAGPAVALETPDHYEHDASYSRSWLLSLAPRGAVYSSVLRELLMPTQDIRRKRIALFYRPLPQATAARLVEADRRAALFKASTNGKKQMNARAQAELTAVEQTAQEEASGAGLVEFSIMATVTVDTELQLNRAESLIEEQQASARIQLRPARRTQASAFTCTLPVGLLPWELTLIPQQIRDAM
ncbi:SCO6880 family protein [Streptomyces sp. MA5143a]|uniref:SCO6880 family protein n=1 Tax=Streptomyces sp. MA5143a TaxID=2083010 RepID=UPI000D1A322B|nr:SCO6880 family protein [Streptomyces sp. MA5143a]SPF07057.1 Type IV secretory pathway, VirB4 components [Streptomyces sp. MA5143a]